MLTEVRNCDLLIVVTSSTFLKNSIYIDKCTVYTYTVYMYTAL